MHHQKVLDKSRLNYKKITNEPREVILKADLDCFFTCFKADFAL